MRRAAIVSPLRTAVGKFQGGLSSITAGDLGAVILRALVERTKLDPERVDDVIFAQGYGNGEAPCIARWSALAADFPIKVPGYQLDRRCGSGLQSVIDAAMMVQTGAADVVIAGGVESMSNAEYYTLDMRNGARSGSTVMHDRLTRGRVMSQPISRFGVISGMIETAENLAKDYGISREACDEYAAASHQRAAAAWTAGKFDNELVPVSVPQKKGEPIVFKHDEGIRADASPETLSKLRAIEKGGVERRRGDGGQCQPAERRGGSVHRGGGRQAARTRPSADGLVRRLGSGGMRSRAHGHRPGAGGGAAVRAQQTELERYRPGGIERSLRTASSRCVERQGLVRQ
jgi:acetyl-CoA C-acetyltransferase